MPVYVYRNLTTGETFEVQQSITESAWTLHPETGDPVKRVIQPVGIAFKGSGFYVTDSRAPAGGASKGAAPVKTGNGATDSASAGSDKASDKATDSGAKTPPAASGSSSSATAGAAAD